MSKSDEWIVKRVAETLCQNRNEIILITSAQSLSNFHSKLAVSPVTLFVKYFHYFTRKSCNIMDGGDGGHAKGKRAIIGFILNRESII